MPNGDHAVDFTERDRNTIAQTHETVIRLETSVEGAIKPTLDDLATRLDKQSDIINTVTARVDSAEGGVLALKWVVGLLVTLLGTGITVTFTGVI